MERFGDLDRKVESVEREFSSMSVKLDGSVTTQHELVDNLKKLKRASKSQFNRVSDHLVSSGETVYHLTDAMAEMRSEMGRLSTIIQGIATRQLDQETAPLQRQSPQSVQKFTADGSEKSLSVPAPSLLRTGNNHVYPTRLQTSSRLWWRDAVHVPLPDSSSDNSVVSSTSKQSHGSVNTVVSEESECSQASSIIRSPPRRPDKGESPGPK